MTSARAGGSVTSAPGKVRQEGSAWKEREFPTIQPWALRHRGLFCSSRKGCSQTEHPAGLSLETSVGASLAFVPMSGHICMLTV